MSKSKRNNRRPSLRIRDLERRILLSATWIDTSAVEETSNAGANEGLESQSIDATLAQIDALLQAEAYVTPPGSDQQLPSSLSEQAENLDSGSSSIDTVSENDSEQVDSSELRHELVLISEEVPDVDQLLAGIRQDANTLFDVYVVDRSQSGWEQLQNYLVDANIQFDAIHFVTHGTNAGFQFGSDWVNSDTLLNQSETLAQVGQFLSEDADLLLYGCSIAETDAGQNIVTSLAQLTSADVAASSDLTGHWTLGGDWDLEYRVGNVESSFAFSEDLQGNWQYTMVTYTLLDNFASASYSNNNGTNNFAGSWTESDAGGAGAGSGHQLITGGQLRLQPVNAANWIYRDANLSGANSASVSFYYNSTLDNNSNNTSIMFQVSSDGGSNYTTLYTFDKTTNITSGTLSTDISAYISSNMRFRFDVGTGASGSNYLYVDDFQVTYGVNTAPTAVSDTATAVEAGGVNNGTAGTNPTGNVLTNDTDADAGDTKTVSGVAAGVVGSASTNVGANVSGTYGSINIAANGSYTYTVDNNNAAVQALFNTSNTLTDVFTYTMRDTLGLTSTTQITVTIQGANDTPTDISGSLSVSENAANGTNVGSLTTTDADAVTTTPTVYVNENFESGATGWTNNTTETASGLTNFLGRFAGSGGNQAVSKTFSLASNLQIAVVEFDLYRIDSWDGETFRVFVNDTQSLSIALNQSSGFTQTSGTTGNVSWVATPVTSSSNTVFGGWTDQQIRVTLTITQPTASLKVGFGSTLDQDVSDEAYGIDNFKITGSGVAYSLVDNAGGRFAVDSLTGAVTVANSSLLNFESATSHNVTVRATDFGGQTYDEVMAVTLSDVDEFDVGAVTDSNATTNTVAENAANGTAVGVTATASDADGSNNTISYTLDNNAGGRFSIGSSTGIVTVANSTLLNFESATSHSITVRATSSDGSFSTQSFTINLSDVDEFDVGSVTDTNASANTIAENTSNGTAVGITASASDADGSNNTITYSLDDNAGGRFTIASGTGIVTVANSTLLNFESATSHNVTVRATSSDGSFSTQVFTISLTDVDEFDVGSITDTNATANTVVENSANGTAVGITASASDADGSNNTITYSLDDNAGGRFAIASGTGIVTVANSSLLDFESASFHNITVRATSSDGSFSTHIISVTVTNANETPTAVLDTATATEAGGVSNGTAGSNPSGNVLTNDTDPDSSDTKTVTGVAAGVVGSASTNVGSNVTGTYGTIQIAANGAYTYTVDNSNATVQALRTSGNTLTDVFTYTMRDTAGLTSTTQITVTIQGANDAPHDLATAGLSVAENSANTTTVGTITRSDVDSGDTATYSLVDNAGGRFAINSASGVITVANSTLLNFEAATTHNVTVRVTDTAGATYDEVFTINLTDIDEFDVGSVTDTNATANTVAENAANGTTVGVTAIASDADGSNNTITYTLDNNAGGRFAIASGTGIVTVANSTLLNFESATSHSITVRATSSDGSFSTQSFTINLSDVDEFDVGSVTDTNATANTIAENTANGTAVGITASASDADGSNNSITYSLDDNAGGRFAIASGTGIVTVANSTLLNFESATSHNVTVRATSSDGSFSTQVFTISLTDVDEFDVGSVTDTNATANTIAENTANGTAVGITASASDADGSNNTITYSLDDNAGGRFTIASGTGVVTVANSTLLNFESATSHNITVRATSSDGSFSTQIFTISLTDVDEFDVGSVTDTNATANTIAENTANGTAVGITASASDADGSNNTITYSLDDNAGGRFAIAGGSGIITVANSTLLNFESSTSHNVTVRATSSDGSFSTQTFTISLTDVDEFDVGTVTDTNAAANSIAENTANGSAVGVTAFATDADATNNTITYTLDDTAGGRFTVHASTGVVTVANSTLLNYEAATSHNITVRATSADGSFSTQIFTVNLTDVDEFDVGAISDSNASANTIAENSANGTAVGITANASDADATNNTITYTLDDNASGRFSIHATTGIVTVANSTLLNYEAATSHNITVRATSADGSFSTQVYTVNLTDVDEFDVGSVTDTNATSNNVNENASVGASVGITASASDADSTNNTITYSLFNSDGGRFAIDSTTGVVTVAGAINREADGASRSITVRATSSDGSYTDQIFSIAINDVDEFDVGSVTDTNATSNNVNENASVGTLVGITAAANDADSTNNTITYSLQNSDGGRFAIDSTTGIVTVAGAINREVDGASRSITVRATSSDGSYTDQIFSIGINDVDEFDVGSVTDTNATSNNVNENASVGTLVGITAAASDADSTNNTITYSLFNSDGGRFAIDSTTGVVTVAGAINREVDGASRSITVRATSSDGSYTDQIFSIAINDVDEFDVGSVTDTNATSNNVNENASVGTVVGITAAASDADSTNNAITYSLQNSDGGRFAIDSTTGVVTVAGAINREADGASRSITVRATSSDGSYTDQIFSITINDVDEFDVGSVTDTNATSNNVNENASVGTLVGITAAASDADSTNNAITYSLQNSDGGRFAIDSTTGVVTVAGAINREADGASRSITVRATSSDGSYTDQIFSIAINDVDEFDVGSVTDTNATSNNVNENASVGTVVGITAAASDADSTNNTITYSLFDNDGGRFAIDSTTGVVTVASAINREADGASRSITVRATSSDGSYTDQVFSIGINDVDEFDVGSVTDTNATSNNVNENASVGTVVGITAAASDADSTNNTITYSLFDNDGGRFAIDSTTGVVTVASAINREADGASRSITVRATSSDGSYTDQIFSIAINDVDEFDVGSVTDTNATSNNVNENASVGTTVGITAAASDADSTNNIITYSLFDNDGGRFAIDSTTGVVTVASTINRELDGASRSITVRATSSDGSYTDQVFSIAINDVDEFDVGSVTDTNASSNNVNENASVGTVVGITASASDADSTNNTIAYSLFDNDGGRFAIDSTTGVVTVAGAINREIDGASRSITVRATSSDGSYTDQIFSIAINDVDEFDVGSVTDTNATSNNVNENASVGTVVGITAAASDADSSNNTITYSLFDNDGGRFAIDSTTGVVTVASAINREADGASRSITVRATSSDGSYTDQIFSIAINDVDEFDVGSVTDTNASSNNVNENATVGTLVGITASASDADSTNNAITYSLQNNDGGRFAIDSTTGVVTVAGAINREIDGASRSITVRATSSDGSYTDQIFSIAINDVDEFDVGSVTDTNATSNNVNENASVGTVVGITAAASDADSSNNTITYSLFDNDGGRFAIDSTTGVVTVASAINREADGASRSITVRATSSDGSYTDQVFSIAINDVDEFDVGSVIDTNASSNNVNENASVGTVVGITASASDADSTNNTITYSLFDNDGGRFAIDSTTGVVTVAGAINREIDGASRSITVRATSSDGSYTDQIFSIAINDVDEFDVGSVTDTNATSNNVNENASVGTVVGITAAASDADSSNNTITYSLFDNDGGRFAIDSTTGVVTVASAINREADGASRSITVRATSSDGSYTDQIFSIAINDVDEFDVGSVTDTNASSNNVNENATVGTLVGITASASDADSTNNAITYSLQNNDGGRFAIDSTTGVVTVASAINREADGASRSITVRATSSDGSYTDQIFSIAINDVDEFDVGSVTDTNATSNNVNENASVGTTVGITAAASDTDSTNNTITYSLFDDDGGRFAIDSTTGVVTVAGAINREVDGASRTITVRATSSDGSHTDQIFSIAINDVDEFDVGSVTDTNATSNNVNENASVGTIVGITAAASDADSTNNTITYSLFDNDGGRFAIDSTTGVVTVAGAINREADGASRSITVRATSSDGSHTDQIFSIAINDVDEFDVGSVTDTNAISNNVSENASVGTIVGITAAASDADSTNNTITYSLFDNDGGRFAIDSTTGVVTVAGAINREVDGASRSITVRATSSDGSHTDQVFSIGINDVDEFDVGSVTDTNATSNNVNENASVGTVVGITAAASDADSTNNTITYSLFDNDGGRFAIDSTTGVVTVAGTINRESDGASRSITVRATSSDGSYTDQIFSIAINDVDEFDVGSVTDTNATSNDVNENASVGTVVGITAAASDADSTNNTITYSLFDNDGGRFAIDSNTGVVTVAGTINREADGASRSITVRATSSDGSHTDQIFSIAINDVDEFDVGSVTDTNATSNNVNENASVGTLVGITAAASDADSTNNTITYSLFDNDGGHFAIDSTTGVVTVAGAINREADGASRSITVRATSSDGSYTDQIFSIAINDVDEFDVGSVTDTNASSNNVNENASVGTVVGITAAASDADATTNTITYSLFDNDGGRFAIDSNTGVVTVASALDREADGASRSITIRATSTDGSYTDQVFSIAINDVDEFDVGAVSDTNATSNNVNENASIGTAVGITAAASDVDATNNAITYSLFDDDGGRFAIDGTTGIVTVAGTIDREVDGASRSITVRATSADGSYTDQVFSIAINDVDEFDVGSVTDTNATSNNVDENASVGTIVGITAAASDGDATNNAITYSLFDNDGGRFAIDSTTGIVTVAGAIDREIDGASRSITIRATSADGSFTDQLMSIAINDLDEFDVGSVTDADVATNVVNENAAIGTTVGLVAYANDLDATTSTISYSLVNNDGGRFAIDSVTGAVTVANSIDRELDGAVRSIIVRATSADGSFTDQNFSIQINDVNEFDVTSSFDTDSSANEILENTLGNATVGLAVIAQDLDATTNIVTFSLDNDAGGRFSIDAVTGVVTQNGPLDHETTPTLDIIVRATSDDGSFSQTSFTIHVLNANEFPFAIDDAYNSGENAQATLNVMSNDYDLDPGDQIQLVSAQLTQGMGSVQVIGNTLLYNPGNAYDYLSVGESVLVVINYQIEDSFGLTDNASVAITIAGQRDQLAVTVGNVQGSEDLPFAWPISVNMVDTNGETLTDVVVRGLPVGTEVTDQFGMTRIVGNTGAVSVFGMDLGSLQYLTPHNFSGLIQATVDVVSSLGNNFIQSFPCTVDIAPVADIGEIFATGGRTDLGSSLALPISYYIEDMDGSEIPTLGISGIPQGMRITDGTNNYVSQNATQWANLNGWNLTSLRLVTDGGIPGDYNFTYRLTIVEGANGSTAVIQQTIKVVVDEVLPQISSGSQASLQTIPLTSTSSQETSPADEPQTAAVATEETAEMSTTELNPEINTTNEVTNYVFETDSDIEREFDSLLRATANNTSARQPPTFEFSLTEQFGDTVDGSQSGNGVRTMEEFEMAVEALQEITETEELLRNQSELEVETQQQFSIQSSLIAFWNLIRANILPQETNTESDARNEIRVTQRTDRRDE